MPTTATAWLNLAFAALQDTLREAAQLRHHVGHLEERLAPTMRTVTS